jgi:hypothetical protein
MTPELENRLRAKYPQLLKDLSGDPARTPLARGIECGDGWHDLIDRLLAEITSALDQRPDPEFTLTQVKQKFGTLRVYTTATEDLRIQQMISVARAESAVTCERCGVRGATFGTFAWGMQTLCPSCRGR